MLSKHGGGEEKIGSAANVSSGFSIDEWYAGRVVESGNLKLLLVNRVGSFGPVPSRFNSCKPVFGCTSVSEGALARGFLVRLSCPCSFN